MKTFLDLQNLISQNSCSTQNFYIDKDKNCVKCLDKEALITCKKECGIITQITWYLIENDIDYTVTKNFDILIEISE